ncbi:MAG: hypothetical protein M3464_05235 [Chloroflexota bacterium]|nr:hypothetical protein [Chloroflexota bacterium]
MDKNERLDRIRQDAEKIVRHLAEGGAGGTIGPDGVRLGMPNWEERTKHPRPSERV